MKYPRIANAKNVRPDYIQSDQARAAWERMNTAIAAHDALEDQQAQAEHAHELARLEYAKAIKDAAESGGNMSKIKVPTAPNNDGIAQQMDAHRTIAWDAAVELRDALAADAPEIITSTHQELHNAVQRIHGLLGDLREALGQYGQLDTRRAFFRALQADPTRLPTGFGSTRDPLNLDRITDEINSHLDWQLDDLIRLRRTADNPEQIQQLDTQIHNARIAVGR